MFTRGYLKDVVMHQARTVPGFAPFEEREALGGGFSAKSFAWGQRVYANFSGGSTVNFQENFWYIYIYFIFINPFIPYFTRFFWKNPPKFSILAARYRSMNGIPACLHPHHARHATLLQSFLEAQDSRSSCQTETSQRNYGRKTLRKRAKHPLERGTKNSLDII